MDYSTVDALRKFAGVSSFKDDQLLAASLSAASRAIEKVCGRRFACNADTPTAHVFTRRLQMGIDPFDGQLLLLDDDLALAATSITDSPTVSYRGLEPPYWAIINEDGSWSSPITVTGFWAYSVAPPPDIEFCCLRLTKWIYEMRETTRGDGVVVTDQGAVLLPAALPADVMALLGPYRRLAMAHS